VTTTAEVLLGVIALATLASAITQIGVIVAAGRVARRVERLADQFEQDLKPIFGHLNAIGRDASRAAALATEQVLDPVPYGVAGRPGQLEELVEEPADVGQYSDALGQRGIVILGERETTAGTIQTAGVFVEVARAPLDLGHGAPYCQRGLQGHRPTLRRND